jgi:3-hydroxymyristoyl/3-hydroxydecanoyl-(acyl carrier protein) dehydratase
MKPPDWHTWPVLARRSFAPGHPALAGHFPAQPVLPGALLLDWVCAVLAGAQPLALREARFARPCGPGSQLALRAQTGGGSSRFAVTLGQGDAETIVVSGTLAPLPASVDQATPS